MPRPKTSPQTENQKRIVELRERLRWNQAQLGTALGVALATVGRWESGVEPSAHYWQKLEEVARENGYLDLAQALCRIRGEKLRPPADEVRYWADEVLQVREDCAWIVERLNEMHRRMSLYFSK